MQQNKVGGGGGVASSSQERRGGNLWWQQPRAQRDGGARSQRGLSPNWGQMGSVGLGGGAEGFDQPIGVGGGAARATAARQSPP